MTTYPYDDDDECDCEMCRTTRQLQAMVTPRETATDGHVVEGLSTIAYAIVNGGVLTFAEVDVSNSGDLDGSYNNG